MGRMLVKIQHLKHARLLAIIILCTFIGGASTAITRAAIPDSSGVIHACYTTGLLGHTRLMDSTSTACSAGETALTWDQTGAASGVLQSDVSGKDLSGAAMVYWNLGGINFSDADLSFSNLRGSDLTGANISGTNFEYASLDHANFTNQNLSNIDFTGADLRNSNLSGATFSNLTVDNANLSGSSLSSRNLSGTSWSGANLSGSNLSNSTFDLNPDFHLTHLESSNLTNDNFSGANFSGANLSNTTTTGATFTGATWTDPTNGPATCPDNTTADMNGDTCIGHL